MLKVGLTGGIASGKSHVLRRLAQAGFQTLDLDAVARDVMAPGGTAYADIVRAFGERILAADGAIDRKALGAHVFADAAARRRLEALVHPRIREAEARYLSAGAPDSVAVVDAALLVESGQHLRFARLVVVFCEPREQLRRLMARDGLTEADARARLDAQMPPGEKRRFGHFVVDNSRAPRGDGCAGGRRDRRPALPGRATTRRGLAFRSTAPSARSPPGPGGDHAASIPGGSWRRSRSPAAWTWRRWRRSSIRRTTDPGIWPRRPPPAGEVPETLAVARRRSGPPDSARATRPSRSPPPPRWRG